MKSIWDMLAPQMAMAQEPQVTPTQVPMSPMPKPAPTSRYLASNESLGLPAPHIGIPEKMDKEFDLPLKSVSVSQKVSSGKGENPAAQYQSEMDDLYMESIGNQKRRIGDYEQELKGMGERPDGFQNMDLSQLYGFADDLTGSKMSPTYKAPTKGQEWDAKKMKLQTALDSSQGKLTDDQMAYLKMQADAHKADEATELRKYMFGARQDDKNTRGDMGIEFKLRNEWDNDPITKNTKTINESYQKILEGVNSDSPAAYLTAVFGLMKMQDPGSVVRESEFRNGEGIGGWPEKWKVAYMNARGAGRITDVQRKAILQEANNIRRAQLSRQEEVDAAYRDLASSYGSSPDRVVLSRVFKNKPGGATSFAVTNPEVQSAKAWLADPANAASPDRAGVEAKLKELGVL